MYTIKFSTGSNGYKIRQLKADNLHDLKFEFRKFMTALDIKLLDAVIISDDESGEEVFSSFSNKSEHNYLFNEHTYDKFNLLCL